MATNKKVIGITEQGTLEVDEKITEEINGEVFLRHHETYFYEKERLLKKKAMLEADLEDCNNLLSHFE